MNAIKNVGILSSNNPVRLHLLSSAISEDFEVEELSLEEMGIFRKDSKFSRLKTVDAVIIDGCASDFPAKKLASLLHESFSNLEIVYVRPESETEKSTRMARVFYLEEQAYSDQINAVLLNYKIAGSTWVERISQKFRVWSERYDSFLFSF